MKKLFLWVLMAGSNFWANAQVQVVMVRYFEEITVNYKYNAGTTQLLSCSPIIGQKAAKR
jgi:hypothetical protein